MSKEEFLMYKSLTKTKRCSDCNVKPLAKIHTNISTGAKQFYYKCPKCPKQSEPGRCIRDAYINWNAIN